MDRAMVYSEKKDDGIIYFISNIPFDIIPKGFILALRNRNFSELEFYAHCKDYSNSEFYWNILGLTENATPISIVWGMYDKLEKILCITRVSIHPLYQSCKRDLLKKMMKEVIDYSRKVGANDVIIITKNPNPYLRKLKNIIKKSDSCILELIEGVI